MKVEDVYARLPLVQYGQVLALRTVKDIAETEVSSDLDLVIMWSSVSGVVRAVMEEFITCARRDKVSRERLRAIFLELEACAYTDYHDSDNLAQLRRDLLAGDPLPGCLETWSQNRADVPEENRLMKETTSGTTANTEAHREPRQAHAGEGGGSAQADPQPLLPVSPHQENPLPS